MDEGITSSIPLCFAALILGFVTHAVLEVCLCACSLDPLVGITWKQLLCFAASHAIAESDRDGEKNTNTLKKYKRILL